MKVSSHFLRVCHFALICLAPLISSAQTLENVNARVQGNQIIVEYDLRSSNEKDRYEINLFSSHNNFSSPLTMVQGDVGRSIYPGKKKITWEAKNELRTFNGTLTFEVKGSMLASVISLNPIAQIRRGKTANITWKGGAPAEPLKIDLLDREGKLLDPIASTPNKGSFAWSVPADKKKGNYKIQVMQHGEATVANVKILAKIRIVITC